MSKEIENYEPMQIRQEIDAQPRDVITHQRWNELFTLLITQGDHTVDWLEATITRALNIEDTLTESIQDTESSLNSSIQSVEDYVYGLVEGDISPGAIVEYKDQSSEEEWKDYIYRIRITKGKPHIEVISDGSEEE